MNVSACMPNCLNKTYIIFMYVNILGGRLY